MNAWKLGLGMVVAALSLAIVLRGTVTPEQKPEGKSGSALPELHITCDPDSFAAVCARYQEDVYIPAKLQMGKQTWSKAKLRLRGDSSREFPKKSLKVKVMEGDEMPFGRTTLNLNAEYLDRTYLRQYLCTRIFQASGQPCFDATHVAVYFNGRFRGIHLLVEGVDDDFLQKRKLSLLGDLYKATKDSASLSLYDDVQGFWEKKLPKKDTAWTPLETLIARLNLTPDDAYWKMAQETFHYEHLVNAIAVNMLIGNRSTYYHNYFMYRDPQSHRWLYLPWDLDNTFIPSEVDDPYQRGNLSDSHWGDMASNPLFERAIADPRILADIQRRVRTLTRQLYHPDHLFPIIDSVAALLAPYMAMDTLYHQHTVEGWQQEIDYLKAYIEQRPEILDYQFAHSPTSFRLIRPESPLRGGETLRWRAAVDPDSDPLTYRCCYSPEDQFTREFTRCHAGIPDTFFTLPQGLAPGKYYWKVLASDGEVEVRGFDNRCTFEVVRE